jgi:competence protein ComEC
MQKPKLFETNKSFVWSVAVLLLLLIVRLFFEYHAYRDFVSKPFYYTYANVLNAYSKSKNGKHYKVLKLRSDDGFTFYTTSHKKEDFNHKRLRLQIYPNKSISFKDYLGTFYVKSRIKSSKRLAFTFIDKLLKKVASQHTEASLQSFYNAIFFATPLNKELREQISMLGVSHLVALSGFHLGILWGLLYGLLLFFYKPLQQKFFPYRYALIDVGLVVILLLSIYLWFVNFPASLVRSYAMLLVAWFVLVLGIELISFTFLTTILLTLVTIFPSFLVSLGFWLSVLGVFYIFLLLQYTKEYNKWLITMLFIPFGIFVLMLPVVHHIFAFTSLYQLLSPLLSLLFILFYPLVMFLHLLGYGGVFDNILLQLFALPQESVENILPLWMTAVYVALSIGAIWYKKLFYLVLGLAFGYGFYLFIA